MESNGIVPSHTEPWYILSSEIICESTKRCTVVEQPGLHDLPVYGNDLILLNRAVDQENKNAWFYK